MFLPVLDNSQLCIPSLPIRQNLLPEFLQGGYRWLTSHRLLPQLQALCNVTGYHPFKFVARGENAHSLPATCLRI